LLAALSPCLNGRAFNSTVRAVNTTITFLRFQHGFAVFALVEKSTCILWHGLFFGESTFRAGDGRFELYDFHLISIFSLASKLPKIKSMKLAVQH